ncbi:MAG TPA: hypothetical protein VHE09_13450 [Rhizomicrobium sp.]|jgi:hypothetical protein|nr:hypothetical protein [Rhizomicrobium sp.]
MTSSGIRTLCVAGAFAYLASAACAYAAAPAEPLDLTAYTTVVDKMPETNTRLAAEFDLGLQDDLPVLSFGPPAFQPNSFETFGTVPLTDTTSFSFGANTDLAGKINPFDAAGSDSYDGLFFSAPSVNSPYASLANGGSFASLNFTPLEGLRFSVGGVSLTSGNDFYTYDPSQIVARFGGTPRGYDTRSANSLLAGVSWNFVPWAGIGFTASQTDEHNGVLGSFNPAVQNANTSAVGVSARLQLGGGWMTTASFAEGITKLDLKSGAGGAVDEMRSRSYGFAVAKRGLFGNDAMGLAVSRPAPGTINGSEFALLSGVDANPQLLQDNRLLQNQAPETDFELGYVTTFMDGAVALQTNASYQMNFAGQSGATSVSLLSRAKIKF